MTVPCCDMHNVHCEPPSELCCYGCTEAAHPEHPLGVVCVLVQKGTSSKPGFCYHPDQQETVEPSGRVLVTCPSCPAEAIYENPSGGRTVMRMMPWLLDG